MMFPLPIDRTNGDTIRLLNDDMVNAIPGDGKVETFPMSQCIEKRRCA